MAEDGAERPAGGFSLSKRYGPLPAWAWGLLGGGGIYAVYRFRQARQAGAAGGSTAAAGTSDTQQVDFAPQIATLQAEIQQLQQGESGEGVSTPPTTTSTGGGGTTSTGGGGSTTPAGGGSKKMPNVVGERANFAIGELKTGYGVIATTVPPRNPRQEYTVTGQTPRAGADVVPGSRAILRIKVDQARRPGPRPRRTSGVNPGGPVVGLRT